MVPWNIVAPKNDLRPWSIRMSSILKMLCISTVTPQTFWLWGIERLAFLDARDKNGMAEKSSRAGPKPQLILGRKTRGTKGNMPEIAWNMIVKWLINSAAGFWNLQAPKKKLTPGGYCSHCESRASSLRLCGCRAILSQTRAKHSKSETTARQAKNKLTRSESAPDRYKCLKNSLEAMPQCAACR